MPSHVRLYRTLTAVALTGVTLASSRAARAEDARASTDDRAEISGRSWRDGPRRRTERAAPPVPTLLARDGYPLMGFHQEKFFLRDPSDSLRLYPGALLQLDARAAFGRGVRSLSDELGGEALRARSIVRRARLELGGQIQGAWSFLLSGDFAGERPHTEHALVDVELHRALHVSVGQQLVPFTMENRTYEPGYAWMERPLAVRFAQPFDKDIGVMLWGETRRSLLRYEVGFFGGDGPNKAAVDDRGDLAARVVARPLAFTDSIARDVHVGVSATYGMRQLANVNYRAEPLTTDGGFAFWDTRISSNGRLAEIKPSGRQLGLAGELRVPVSRIDLRFEFVYVQRNTRESYVDAPVSETNHVGRLEGTAFYGHLGVWLLGDPSLRPPPGQFRPPRVDLRRGARPAPERGLELAIRFESMSASYDRAARDPGAPELGRDACDRLQCIDVRALGAGLSYHATRHASVMLNYSYYVFPDSGTPDSHPTNAAVAPGNLNGHAGAHQLHELAGRLQVFF